MLDDLSYALVQSHTLLYRGTIARTENSIWSFVGRDNSQFIRLFSSNEPHQIEWKNGKKQCKTTQRTQVTGCIFKMLINSFHHLICVQSIYHVFGLNRIWKQGMWNCDEFDISNGFWVCSCPFGFQNNAWQCDRFCLARLTTKYQHLKKIHG